MLNSRLLALAIVSLAVFLAPARMAAQAPASNASTKAKPVAKPAKWMVPRLPDGRPELAGYWNTHTSTPLQRLPDVGGREFLTDDEVKAIEERAARPPAPTNNPFPSLWAGDVRWVMPNKRTSIITEPKDGKISTFTPEAQRKIDADREEHKRRFQNGPEDMTTFERCLPVITSGPPMLPTAYNNNYQIFQTHDHLAIATEMMHDVRIIPLDGRPHSDIRQWMGDPRGHWEGDTLVVETTNFNGKRGHFGPLLFNGDDLKRHDEKMTVTERFTRTAPDMLLYQFTVNDPGTFTAPWSGEIVMKSLQGPILEYACHEGNHAMELMLSGARAEERAAAKSGSR